MRRPRHPAPTQAPPPDPKAVEATHEAAQTPTPVETTPAAGSYERAQQIERAAYGLAIRALLEKSPDAGRLVAVHAQAAGNLIRTRQDVLALEQQEARLLTAEWVKETITAHDGAVATLAKAMPRMMAGRIAPHDSEHAEAELSRWVEEEFLRTLYKSNPWTAPKT
ncbi:MAG: hypothetical protein QM845_01115 [Verrucomicrobiota bacterium]|nr:hypothetical protein [Verrucomicrobiota bacterium]